VAFLSDADNLLAGDPAADPNGFTDVFLVDTTLGTIRLVSDNAASGDPADGPAVSVDISGTAGGWSSPAPPRTSCPATSTTSRTSSCTTR
jgi:hypothetical protein